MKRKYNFSEKFEILVQSIMLTFLMLVMIGCTGTSSNSSSNYELSVNPFFAFKKDINFDNISLWGIKLGDPESKIPKSKIFNTNPFGWRMCNGGARFRVKDGKIVELRISDELIEKLGITRERQIQDKLGNVDKVKIIGNLFKNYIYHRGKIDILLAWNGRKKEVDSINIIDKAHAIKL